MLYLVHRHICEMLLLCSNNGEAIEQLYLDSKSLRRCFVVVYFKSTVVTVKSLILVHAFSRCIACATVMSFSFVDLNNINNLFLY